MREYPIGDYREFNVLRKILKEMSEVIINMTAPLRKHEDNTHKSLPEVIINMTTERVHWGLKS